MLKKDLHSAEIGDGESAASKNLVQKISVFFIKQNDGRLIPFVPSKVTWSFSAKEIQENLTLSTKNVFITFQVSFKSENRSETMINNSRHHARQVHWRLTRYFTMCENVHITDFQSFRTVRFFY